MKRRILLAVMVIGCVTAVFGAKGDGPDKEKGNKEKTEKLRVLVVTGGHGFDMAVFPEAFAGQDDLDIEFRDTVKTGPGAVFDDIGDWPYDVLVLYNFKQNISEKQRANFLALLEKGVGLVMMHHAIAAFPDWPEFEKIVGAKYFLKEEERDGVKHGESTWKHDVEMAIKVENEKSPVTKGLADFTILDETYGKWLFHKKGSRVLLTTENPLSNQEVAWTRRYGKARVFCTVLGHGPEAYRNESLQRLLAGGIRWAAGK